MRDRHGTGDVDLRVDPVCPFLEWVALGDPSHNQRDAGADRARDTELGLSRLRGRLSSHRHRGSEPAVQRTHTVRPNPVARERRLTWLMTPQHLVPR